MKRMNLLLVHKDGLALRGSCQKLVAKVFRKGLVLALQDLDELDGMLNRLSINCLLVNMDDCSITLEELSRKYPQLKIYGFSRRLPAKQGKVFAAKGFEQDFLLELKELRKSKADTDKGSKFSWAGIFGENFKDFSRLQAVEA